MAFSINKRYNFNTLVPQILGNNYESMKVLSIMTAKEAVKYRDVQTVNSGVLTSIAGLSDDIDDLTFILFESSDGVKVVLANEWIEQSSVSEVSSTILKITVSVTDTDDIVVIRDNLIAAGFREFKITQQ